MITLCASLQTKSGLCFLFVCFFLFFSFLLFVTVGYSQSIQIQKEKKTLKNDKVHSFFLCISASYQQHTSIVRGTSLVINLPVKVYHSPRFHAHYTLTLNNSFVFFFPFTSMKWDVYFEPRTPWNPIQLYLNMAGLIKHLQRNPSRRLPLLKKISPKGRKSLLSHCWYFWKRYWFHISRKQTESHLCSYRSVLNKF